MIKFLKFDDRYINVEYIQEVMTRDCINGEYALYLRVYGYSNPYTQIAQYKTKKGVDNACKKLIKDLAGNLLNVLEFKK